MKVSNGGVAALVLLTLLGAAPRARADAAETADRLFTGREAFSQPLPGLDEAERERFFRGRALFNQSWVVAPAKDDRVDGLGPLYNRLACVSCHAHNGRGLPPERAGERMQAMLVRLSVAGVGPQGGPRPHPAYGDQFNEEGIPGVPGEGRVLLRWHTVRVHGARLRRPVLRFEDLAYGPLGPVLTSPRVGQQVVGMGLIDAVPAATLEALAEAPKPDTVRGRVNRVWNPETGATEVGRFGHKANMPSLRAQIAGAFLGDLGITSPLHPAENCTPVQTACRRAPSGGAPELSAQQLDEVTYYLAQLAVPPRRGADDPAVRRGEARFAALGCTACHRPMLRTGDSASPALAHQDIAPYTDLLLHDMGPGLADWRPDFAAGGREWRTPPLWGLGLTAAVSERARYLHDGRARSLHEAILWHGGEATVARQRYAALGAAGRAELMAFLGSL